MGIKEFTPGYSLPMIRSFLLFLLALAIFSCSSLEQTDKIRSEMITATDGDTLLYEMYQTGLDKYRYEYNLKNGNKTTQLFTAEFTGEAGSEARMDIERGRNEIRVILDKPIENQSKQVNGTNYVLKGTK